MHGTRGAYGVLMWNESDNTNFHNGALPVISAANFTAEVLSSPLPVLVSFSSAWSQPCCVLDLVLHELAREWAGKLKIVKVDADGSLDLSLGYEIRFVPTLLYFIGGKPRERIVGTANKDAILAKLESLTR